MPYPSLAREQLAVQQSARRLTVAAVALQWRRVGSDFDSGWGRVRQNVLTLTTGGQVGAARVGARYVPLVLDQVAQDVPADGRVRAETFGGYAADGRDLGTLLDLAPVRAKEAVAAGASTAEALAAGGRWLADTVGNELTDAGRAGAAAAITARARTGWVRMVTPPCCARCAILAGKWFSHNRGFERHPRCDCQHIPAPESVAGDLLTDPDELYRRGLIRGLTDGQQAALEQGADIGQVVNAYRGMGPAQAARTLRTREGTTRRGVAYRAGVRGARLTPDGINAIASDRAEAVRLLRANGYLT